MYNNSESTKNLTLQRVESVNCDYFIVELKACKYLHNNRMILPNSFYIRKKG